MSKNNIFWSRKHRKPARFSRLATVNHPGNKENAYSEPLPEPDIQFSQGEFRPEYKVLRLLGNGSNSSVYLARHRASEVLFAVKKLSKSKISESSSELRNFKVISPT